MDEKNSEGQEQAPSPEPQNVPAAEEVKPEVIGAAGQPEEKSSGMAIGAMVVGIVGVLCAWIMFLNFILGVTALVLGIIELKRIKDGVSSEKGRGMAITGIILGSLALLGAVIYIIVIAVTAVTFATGMSGWMPSIMDQFGSF